VGEMILLIHGKEYYCHNYKTNGFVVLELERKLNLTYDNLEMTMGFVGDLIYGDDLFSYNDKLVEVISELTGYARVMFYKFKEDCCGEVIAEHAKEKIYVGKTFPASDIPQDVRGLFLRNKSRYISDALDEGVGMYVKESNMLNMIDSSLSDIASLSSPSHRQYLVTMNVRSSFSLAIVVKNKLYGLIICHNIEPLELPPSIRKQCCNIVQIYSDKLSEYDENVRRKTHKFLYHLYQATKNFENVPAKEIENTYLGVLKNITKYLQADYVISNVNGQCLSHSYIDLPNEQCSSIYYLLNSKDIKTVVLTTNVKADVFTGTSFSDEYFSALLYVRLNACSWVAFIKRASNKTIKWAGKPDDISVRDGIRYPRTDFSVYETKTKNEGEKWLVDYESIEEIQQLLCNIINRIDQSNSEEIFVTENDNIQKKKNLWIANLTHEIRSPLNALVGIFDILQSNVLDIEEYKEILKDGIKVANTLQGHITNLIDFTKNKNGYSSVQLHQMNIEEIVNNVYDIYKYMVKPGVRLEKSIDPKIPKLLIGDETKISQIISNLVGNSCKYTNEGKISISIIFLNNSGTTLWIDILVQDTGIGFAKDKQYLIFREFEQMDKIQSNSSGLGLSLCYQLANMMNGSITFESDEGWGTTFKCRLPLVVEKSEMSVKKDNNLKVLVVEDYEISQKVMKKKLESYGFEVTIAKNGSEAVDFVKNGKKYDIIFMDIYMPVMNGVDATHLLRESYGYTGTIIGLSGSDDIIDQSCNNGLMDDFLVKPIDYSALQSIVMTYISKVRKI
jgi:light-regulated signal transduction histidine kinase (bacteriophytochrome)/CheY-like chemotaxis protein